MKRRTVGSIFAAALLLLFARQSLAIDYSGIWWDPAFAGEGVTVHQEDGNIFGGWYLYDGTGLSTWLTFEGTLSGNTLTTSFKRFTGPPFGGAWNPSQVVGIPTGSLNLTFNSSSSATFAYSLDGSTGTLNLVPFGNKTQHLDGFYMGTVTPSSPSAGPYPCDTLTMRGSIIDRRMRGWLVDSAGDPFIVQATVGSDGSVSGIVKEIIGLTQVATFTGSVDGVNASGTWSDVVGCSGSWSAAAQ